MWGGGGGGGGAAMGVEDPLQVNEIILASSHFNKCSSTQFKKNKKEQGNSG